MIIQFPPDMLAPRDKRRSRRNGGGSPPALNSLNSLNAKLTRLMDVWPCAIVTLEGVVDDLLEKHEQGEGGFGDR